MIQITLDEAINAYMVTINDLKQGQVHKEVAERRIDALKIIDDWTKKETNKEILQLMEGVNGIY